MSASTEDEPLLIRHIPSLVSILLAAQNKHQRPLTEEDVLRIRDSAEAVVMPQSAYEAVTHSRGYLDIDPENAWQEWQAFLETLNQDE